MVTDRRFVSARIHTRLFYGPVATTRKKPVQNDKTFWVERQGTGGLENGRKRKTCRAERAADGPERSKERRDGRAGIEKDAKVF